MTPCYNIKQEAHREYKGAGLRFSGTMSPGTRPAWGWIPCATDSTRLTDACHQWLMVRYTA